MTDTADVSTLPGKPMFQLATKPRHVPGDAVNVPAASSKSGLPQTERTCKVCGAVKVTVHSPDGEAWREWRISDDAAQMEMEDPPCRPPAGNGGAT